MTIDHQTQLRVHIRWMIRRDMAEVLEPQTLRDEITEEIQRSVIRYTRRSAP